MKYWVFLVTVIFFQVGQADECELTFWRRACALKQEDALRPYRGENPTVEKYQVVSEEVCLQKAQKATRIIRRGTLASKTVSIKFNGIDMGKSFSDSADCN